MGYCLGNYFGEGRGIKIERVRMRFKKGSCILSIMRIWNREKNESMNVDE